MWSREKILSYVLCINCVFWTSTARAVFIDLRNVETLHPTNPAAFVHADDISVLFQGPSLNSTANRFGIDSPGANDKADLLDGGNGFAERLIFLFQQHVIVESIVISEFDTSDAGELAIKSHPSAIALNNGVNELGDIPANRSSAQFVYWRGANDTDTDRGFSVDGFHVRLDVEKCSLEPGNYDCDGRIDGNDFLLWQRDPEIGELADWESQFADGSLSSLNGPAPLNTPEPTSFALLALAISIQNTTRRSSNPSSAIYAAA